MMALETRVWKSLLLATVAGAAVLVQQGVVRAQPVPPESAAASQRFDFDIPERPLARTLNDIGRITGLSIVLTQNAALSLNARSVRGTYTARQALDQALAGTGIGHRFTNARTVTIDPPPPAANASLPAGAIPLDTIEVSGESALGPVTGFVATRSAGATKTDTSLLETPQSISVIGRPEMEARQVQSLTQALQYSPSTNANNYGVSTVADSVTVRGFAPIQFLDGTFFANPANGSTARIEPYGLERIEVVRGPSSILYGAGVPGGMLNMISKRPTTEPLREVQTLVGSNGRVQGAFDLSGPANADKTVLYRLTGLARRSDSEIDYAKDDRVFIAPASTWRPTDSTSITLLGQYLRDDNPNTQTVMPLAGTLHHNPYGKLPRSLYTGDAGFAKFDREQAAIGYNFEHKFAENLIFRQNLRYQHFENVFRDIAPTALLADQRTMSRFAFRQNTLQDDFTVDSNLQASFVTGMLQHTTLIGLDYRYTRRDVTQGFGAAPNIDLYAPSNRQSFAWPAFSAFTRQKQSQTGIYAQDQIRLGGFLLTAGLRHDWLSTENINRQTGVGSTSNDAEFSGRVGLNYTFDFGLSPYVAFSRSFQPVTGTSLSGKAFDPSTGTQYEAGVKYQPPGWNALLTAAVYELTQANVLTPDPINALFSVQTGEARIRGFELEARAEPIEGLSLIASYSYADSEITKANLTGGVDIVGNRFPFVPQHQAVGWVDYQFRHGAFAGLSLGGGVRYRSSVYGDQANLYQTPAVTLVDLAIRYDVGKAVPSLKGLEASLNVSNLFDKEYVNVCTSAAYCRYGDGRLVSAALKYRW